LGNAFCSPVILFNDVVEILTLTDFYTSIILRLVRFKIIILPQSYLASLDATKPYKSIASTPTDNDTEQEMK